MSIRIGNQIISGGAGGGNGDSLTNQNLSSEITQIYNWVGTYAEYVKQDVANAHPDWVCYITDDEFGEDEELQIYQITARNVGDIFFTSRTDEWLNGAVSCDGSRYNISDYEGEESIGNLLKSGKLPFVSFTQYEMLLTANGSVGYFAWDGEGTDKFRVPTLNDLFLETGKANQLGQFVSAGLPNITGTWDGNCHNLGYMHTSGAIYKSGDTYGGLSAMDSDNTSLGIDASRSSSIYGNSDTVQPNAVRYRAMVQIYTGYNDESIDTCREVKEDLNYIKSTISNCITEIPQDIKVELNDGVLTLKAGSKVYVPNGFEADGVTRHFDKIVLAVDDTYNIPSESQYTGSFFLFHKQNTTQDWVKESSCCSGSTDSLAGQSWHIWYDTTENQVKLYTDNASTVRYIQSLPIAKVTLLQGVVKSIQTFNGLGYIGSTVFALPGISGIAPNGRNEDGTLNNSIFTVNSVLTRNLTITDNNADIRLGANDVDVADLIYDERTNFNYLDSELTIKRYLAKVGSAKVTSGKVMSFTPKYTFRAVDYNEADIVIEYQNPTVENNYTWYRKYKSGWVEQGGTSSDGQTSPVTINLPITMLNGKYQIQLTAMITGGEGTYVSSRIATVRNDNNYTNEVSSFKYIVSTTTGSSTVKVNWEVKGIAA